jgi:hypothetical protein
LNEDASYGAIEMSWRLSALAPTLKRVIPNWGSLPPPISGSWLFAKISRDPLDIARPNLDAPVLRRKWLWCHVWDRNFGFQINQKPSINKCVNSSAGNFLFAILSYSERLAVQSSHVPI